jgi:AcrR family transcriptional regulator
MRRKDDEKRNNIKKAVVKIILEQGMHGASISKIAKIAGVSPATVYIYYENKEEMLRDIYHEYASEVFSYILRDLSSTMDGKDFIDVLIRQYYEYILKHEEIHHFVEQFDSCPSLNQGCAKLEEMSKFDQLLTEYKSQGIMNNYDNQNIWAFMFYPVKAIVKKSGRCAATSEAQLNEMIMIIQNALLK